jgi:multidrug transporter EmrE-like cation transporter
MQSFLLIIANIILAVTGQFFIKQGINKVGSFSKMPLAHFFVKAFSSPLVIIGLILYVISAAIWVMVLSKVDLSFAYPMLSLGYVLILIFSAVYLGETISVLRMIGVLFVIAGIFFIYRTK